jgi:hypothetical protein
LAEFLGTDPIGKQLGYERKPNPSTFSKVRKRSDPRIFQELYIWLLQNLFVGIKKVTIFAFSCLVAYARGGVITIDEVIIYKCQDPK